MKKFQANRILIIKHGSLGDIAFALNAIYSVKKKFSNSKIHLLTEKKFRFFFEKSNYFSKIIDDNRQNIFISFFVIAKIIFNRYDLIVDLQNSQRTNSYNFFFRLFSNAKINGSRSNAHFKYISQNRKKITATDGIFNQLQLIDVLEAEDNFDWLNTKIDTTNQNIVLLIPGVSKSGQKKQWSPYNYGELAKYFCKRNFLVIIVGTKSDIKTEKIIKKICPEIISKIDTSPPEYIYSVAKISKLIVTNDTGPGHIAALSKSKILWLALDNNVSKSNLPEKKFSFKVLNKNMSNIKTDTVIKFIENQKLLN